MFAKGPGTSALASRVTLSPAQRTATSRILYPLFLRPPPARLKLVDYGAAISPPPFHSIFVHIFYFMHPTRCIFWNQCKLITQLVNIHVYDFWMYAVMLFPYPQRSTEVAEQSRRSSSRQQLLPLRRRSAHSRASWSTTQLPSCMLNTLNFQDTVSDCASRG